VPFPLLDAEWHPGEQNGNQYVVTDAAGRSLSTNSRPVAEGIGHLVAAFPSSSSLDDCVGAATGDASVARQAITDALYRMLLAGMITLFVRAGAGRARRGPARSHPAGTRRCH
jgi:hypothetical protein